jgi:hypothetical protein
MGSKKGTGMLARTTTGKDSFDDLLSLMKEQDTLPKDEKKNISSPEERLIAHLYNAIDKSIKS